MAKRGFQGAVMRGMGVRDHTVTVTGVEFITPGFKRVHMVSETLFEDVTVSPTAWLRFWFPDPDGKDFEHQRAYTIVEADEQTGELSVDFLLHEPAGAASAWAAAARPGDALPVGTLGSSKFDVPEELPAGYLLIGDAASIPAISGIIGALPSDVAIELYLEEHGEDERLIPIPDHPMLRTHRIRRTGPESLAAAIEDRDWSDWYAWAATEAASLKQLRQRLRDDFGFPKSEIYALAYWIEGRSMGTLRGDGGKKDAAKAAVRPEPTPDPEPLRQPESQTEPQPESEPQPAPLGAGASDAPKARPRKQPRGEWRARAAGRLLRPLKPVFIAAGVLQGLVTLVELAPFFLLVELSRRVLAGAAASELWAIGLWAVALMAAGVVLSAALLLWLHLVDARFERDLRARLLGKLARLPLGWFSARGSGQVKQLVQDDTLSLHYLVTHAVSDAVAAVVAPVAVLVYLFAIDPQLALILLVPVLVYIVTMAWMVLASKDRIGQAQRWAERMNAEAAGYLEGQPVMRVFGGSAASTFRARLGEYIGFLNDWQRPFIGMKTFMDLATRPATFLLLICVFGTLRVVAGGMDPVALLPFLLLGTTFGSRLLGIGYGLSGLRSGLVAARRIQVTLEEPELRAAGEGPGGEGPAVDPGRIGEPDPGKPPAGLVEFDRVGFSYRPGAPVLEEVSLTLEPGTVTALVGPSGSGKSTLASLLARFHDVGEGAIRVGGRDLRELSADELYTRVGFVFQESRLILGTVRENIALAVPEASAEAVEAAARAAQIHERIMRMPQGYDTVLGPDAALSGGERQRLTIARAILADTPVLVLDEATAFADPESEYLVQRALNRLTAGRTVLIIAHRLHTVTGVDRIVVLDRGRVVETGRHDELLARDGRYRRLWEAGGAPGGAPGAEPAAAAHDATLPIGGSEARR